MELFLIFLILLLLVLFVFTIWMAVDAVQRQRTGWAVAMIVLFFLTLLGSFITALVYYFSIYRSEHSSGIKVPDGIEYE